MKKTVLLLLCTLLWSSSYSESQHILRLNTFSDSSSDFPLMNSEIKFSASGDVEIHTKESQDPITFLFSDVKEIVFPEITVGLENVITSSSTIYCWLRDNILTIEGVDSTTPRNVTIRNVSGQNIISLYQLISDPINVSSLPQGVYFITLERQTIKFVK